MEPVHMLWWVLVEAEACTRAHGHACVHVHACTRVHVHMHAHLVEAHADVGRVGKPDESSNPDGEVEPLVARRADAGR